MTLFYIKKAFCDGWDNILSLFLHNLIFIVLGFGTAFLASLTPNFSILTVAIIFIGVSSFLIWLFATNETMAKAADYKDAAISETFAVIPSVIKDALVFGLIYTVVIGLCIICIRFYSQMMNLVGLGLMAVMFWVGVLFIAAMQWYLPIRAQMKNGMKKCFKKSFLLLFDNTGFSIFLSLYSIIIIAISIIAVGLIPGVSGLLLAHNDALKLRLYKYDWMEKHPELSPKQARKEIPWDELIEEDREIIGPRTLKGFIFPWKE